MLELHCSSVHFSNFSILMNQQKVIETCHCLQNEKSVLFKVLLLLRSLSSFEMTNN